MITITLRDRAKGERVVGGVIFTDGVARVTSLGPNRKRYFRWLGARIRHPKKTDDAPTQPEE